MKKLFCLMILSAILATALTSCGLTDEIYKNMVRMSMENTEHQLELTREVLEEEQSNHDEETSLLEQILSRFGGTSADKPMKVNRMIRKSVNLFDMKINECSYYGSIARKITDTIGNEYGYENAYSIGGSCYDGYAIYYLGGEYSTISGKIIVPDDFTNDGIFTISIRTADGDGYYTVYDTGRIDRQTLTIDLSEENIDLSKAEWMKINFDSCWNYVVLKDFCLVK